MLTIGWIGLALVFTSFLLLRNSYELLNKSDIFYHLFGEVTGLIKLMLMFWGGLLCLAINLFIFLAQHVRWVN